MVRTTHTYATMEVSESTYIEIRNKLEEAGYDHAIQKDSPEDTNPRLIMQGIALVMEKEE